MHLETWQNGTNVEDDFRIIDYQGKIKKMQGKISQIYFLKHNLVLVLSLQSQDLLLCQEVGHTACVKTWDRGALVSGICQEKKKKKRRRKGDETRGDF